MKLSLVCSLFLCALLPVIAADSTKQSASPPEKKSAPPKAPSASPAPTKTAASAPAAPATPPPAPAAAPAPTPPPAAPAKSGVSLDAYIADLADQVPLSKDEQTDLKAYYQEDGAKLQGILGNAALSPLQQQQQIDDLRNARNAKIDALLQDADRQARFARLEATYRVALVELAAAGGLTPLTPPPNVPQPTSTPAAQADKTHAGA